MNNQQSILDVISRFVAKLFGKLLDFDNAFASQCVDFLKQSFIHLGITKTQTGDTYQFLDHLLLKKSFTQVRKETDKKGDIFIVLQNLSATGFGGILEYGHIGLC